MLADLLRLLRHEGPLQWDLAFQLAQSVASEGNEEANAEPLARIRLEELVRLADLAVADVTGMTTTTSGRSVGAVALSARVGPALPRAVAPDDREGRHRPRSPAPPRPAPPATTRPGTGTSRRSSASGRRRWRRR